MMQGGDIIRFFHAEEGKYLTGDASPDNRMVVFLRNSQRANKVKLLSFLQAACHHHMCILIPGISCVLQGSVGGGSCVD